MRQKGKSTPAQYLHLLSFAFKGTSNVGHMHDDIAQIRMHVHGGTQPQVHYRPIHGQNFDCPLSIYGLLRLLGFVGYHLCARNVRTHSKKFSFFYSSMPMYANSLALFLIGAMPLCPRCNKLLATNQSLEYHLHRESRCNANVCPNC